MPFGMVESFGGFEKTDTAEFSPHHVLFRQATQPRPAASLPTPPADLDARLIHRLGTGILNAAPEGIARKMAIGLLNTHFDALAHGGYERALIEDFLYLFHASTALGVTHLDPGTALLLDLADHALSGAPSETVPPALPGSAIAAYLATHPIRI